MSVLFLCVVWWIVRWYLADWCMHLLRESNKAADTRADWLMDNGDSGPGAQWEAPHLHEKLHKHVTFFCLSMGPEGVMVWVLLLGYCVYGMNMDPLRKSLLVDVC